MIKNVWNDTDGNLGTEQAYCYRIRTIDTVNDAFNSGSDESKIFDDTHEYTFSNIDNGIATINTKDHILNKGTYALILFDSLTTYGFYYITNIEEDIITFFPAITTNESAKIYHANSIISM